MGDLSDIQFEFYEDQSAKEQFAGWNYDLDILKMPVTFLFY